jgi:hypothetical protein
MDQAVEEFYKIKMVRLVSFQQMLEDCFENIQVIALGDKKVPSIVIYDNGESTSDHFKDSFLSLHQKQNEYTFH